MDKEEPNFNICGEISVRELVLEAAKVEQKYEKQQQKRRFAQLEEDDLQQLAKNKCYCNKQCCEGCISFSSLSKHTFTTNFAVKLLDIHLSFEHFMTSFLWSTIVQTMENCGQLVYCHTLCGYYIFGGQPQILV